LKCELLLIWHIDVLRCSAFPWLVLDGFNRFYWVSWVQNKDNKELKLFWNVCFFIKLMSPWNDSYLGSCYCRGTDAQRCIEAQYYVSTSLTCLIKKNWSYFEMCASFLNWCRREMMWNDSCYCRGAEALRCIEVHYYVSTSLNSTAWASWVHNKESTELFEVCSSFSTNLVKCAWLLFYMHA